MNIVSGRHLAAVMFADVVGYTSMLQRDEGAALAARRRHRAALQEAVPAHGGRIFQFLGDGSVSLFPSAVEAVRAAIDIQQALAAPPPLPLRIGIDQGEITWDEQGIVGDAVNVAARVQAVSVAGAVLVTGKIRDELRNQTDLSLVHLGRVRLKGVEQPVAVHAVAAPGITVPSPAEIGSSGGPVSGVTTPATAGETLGVRAIEVLRDRLSAALGDDYRVEDALDAGGMGLVFRGRDRVLDRHVAIKVLRPELTTERAIERFLREARILARLRHPAIVPVHRAGDADGLPYYVMDLLEGETLEDTLRRGPMPEAQVLSLALTLLDGLAAVHREGVVHRDIKPSNVFMTSGGAVLTDFGIARTSTASTGTGSGRPRVGTPGYMPPEQEAGGEVTQLTDIYAAGMVLYEALTGHRWSTQTDPVAADWSAVPHSWIGPLRRALARSPPERWPGATAFARALSARAGRPAWLRGARTAAIATAIVAGAVAVSQLIQNAPSSIARLAILPFETPGDMEADAGKRLARIMSTTIGTAAGLSLASASSAARWQARAGNRQLFDPRRAARELRVEYVITGTLLSRQDSLVLDLECYDSTGDIRFSRTMAAAGDQLRSLADRATGELLGVIDPRARPHRSEFLSADEGAWLELDFAERDVVRNDWEGAAQHYESAIARDSNFVTARWGLVNAQRWLPLGRAWTFDPVPELQRIAATNRGRLSELDSLLLMAQLSRRIRDRLDRYRAAVSRFPDDGMAALLYGDELFHRGALAGRPMEAAAHELQRAVDLEHQLAPAYAHLAWLYIRRGNSNAARSALDLLRSSSAPQAQRDLVLFEHAFLERFDTAAAARQRARLFGGTSMDAVDLLDVARIGLAFELPAAQYQLGLQLATHPLALPERKANGRYAMALSLLARGRWSEGLAELDSAAALDATVEAALQSAEWRVIPAAIGLSGTTAGERERGRAALRRMTGPGPVGDRAAWALAVADIMQGDTAPAAAWLEARPAAPARLDAQLESAASGPGTPEPGASTADPLDARAGASTADPLDARAGASVADPLDNRSGPPASLRITLEALLIAARGALRDAIERTDPLLEHDDEPGHGDPFVRALLHSSRAGWYERLAAAAGTGAAGTASSRTALLDSARAEWTWSENLDLVGWVTGVPQAAEVDWVLGPWASFRLARLDDEPAACRHARRALEWWADADATLASPVADTRRLAADRCPQ